MNISSLTSLCVGTAASLSNELSADEVKDALDANRLESVIQSLWAFIGHFYKWPEALLSRTDMPGSLHAALEENLYDELGGDDLVPHTELYRRMADSIGVVLLTDDTPGEFMQQVLHNAESLPPAMAIGQFFANEATPKWGGFIDVLSGNVDIDLTFFNVHASEDNHYQGFIQAFALDELPTFWQGVIDYSKMRASFMQQVRQQL